MRGIVPYASLTRDELAVVGGVELAARLARLARRAVVLLDRALSWPAQARTKTKVPEVRLKGTTCQDCGSDGVLVRVQSSGLLKDLVDSFGLDARDARGKAPRAKH